VLGPFVLSQAGLRLGWKNNVAYDVSGDYVRDPYTKKTFLMSALNVYGGPAGLPPQHLPNNHMVENA
jgi:hypothetical protein